MCWLIWLQIIVAHGFQVFLPTNFTNFRASECRTELVRVMPSAAVNVKEIYTNVFNEKNGDLLGRTNFHEFNHRI